ncbi:MAG: winged helix-turn-helix transcriptional regulator [Micromonosporaceae bacterium]|nr:winged helix-turn-helix transcriptional regulator [Micromonosporaceae bacterium]
MGDARAVELARLAGHLADPTRASFLLALLDGRAWTVTELATHAGVAVSTATEHLNRLREAGLVSERRQGRHRYLHLADAEAAQLVEDLAAKVGPPRPTGRGLRAVTAHEALIRARTCYDHLAGRLGVAIADALTERGFVDQRSGLALTPDGAAFLTDRLGVDPQALVPGRRPLIRACLDWTQRRTHLAGVVGAEICRALMRRGWVERIGTGRAVRVTPAGRRALHDALGLAE